MDTPSTLLLGTRKGLLTYKLTNGDWVHQNTSHLGIPVSMGVVDHRSGRWWALLDHGHWGCKMEFSDDEGKTWTEVEAPKFPEGYKIKEDVEATVKYLWAFAEGGADKEGVIWVGSEPGGLFYSNDNGQSFHLEENLWNHPTREEGWFGGGRDYAGIHSIVVDPRDSDHIFVGISVAGVFETTDGGKSWELRNKGLKADFLPDPNSEVGQDPHILVASKTDPDIMWQQNHCGIFKTEDGGKLWEDVSQEGGPAYFGFAIAVDEKDPNTAWVVPAVSDVLRVAVDQKLCVCRTEDGGKTWTDLRNGLPQDNSFDLVYRHCLDIKGDHLMFGTTTGNVYFSRDRGDSWESVTHNLPMIYSVNMF